MIPSDCALERIADGHPLDGFRCGKHPLDDWLRRHAAGNDREDSSRVQILVAPNGAVAGYYALTMASVRKKDLPPDEVTDLPRYPVGAVLLARLAVREDLQPVGGFGSFLLGRALIDAVVASERVAGRIMVVDAIDDEAAEWYRHFEFLDLPEQENRLYLNLKRIASSLREAM